jgi:gamma-glutamylcyclotransferase (GGCT)/AIG2-like uncharacterized protein YtfP
MHVFTYGTLMFPEVWRAVVGKSFATVEGLAPGFAIYRVCDAVFPGIIAGSEADAVSGVVYLDVEPTSVARLDRFEDDFYNRESLWIECADGQPRQADAYVVPAVNRNVLTDQVWRRDEFLASGGLEQFIARFQGFSRVNELPARTIEAVAKPPNQTGC